MITETQTTLIVLQLSGQLLAQLQPFMAGLAIAVTAQRLCTRAEVYASLTQRVGDALNYEVRWCQPSTEGRLCHACTPAEAILRYPRSLIL